MNKVKELLKNERFMEIFLYLVVGGLTTVVNYIAYFLFTRAVSVVFGVPTDEAWLGVTGTAVAWVVAVAFAFWPNKKYVFKSYDKSKEVLVREISGFVKARLLSLALDAGLMWLFMTVFRMHDMVAKLICQAAVIVFNYFASKLFIFKKS